VFQAVRRCDSLLEREPHGSLFRDGVAEVGVSVYEHRQDDVRRTRGGLLDSLYAAVLDDDASTDRLERLPGEYRPLYLFHTGSVL
jgi:hypothetical protein